MSGRPMFTWETPAVRQYLDAVAAKILRAKPADFKALTAILADMVQSHDLNGSQFYDICNIFKQDTSLLLQIQTILPPNFTIHLAEDYASTGLVSLRKARETIWCAAFGLLYAGPNQPPTSADDKIMSFLASIMVNEERAIAAMNLKNGDVKRTLDILYDLVNNTNAWRKFSTLMRSAYRREADQMQWRRLRELLYALAKNSLFMPLPLRLEVPAHRIPPVNAPQYGHGIFHTRKGAWNGRRVFIKAFSEYPDTRTNTEAQIAARIGPAVGIWGYKTLAKEAVLACQLNHPNIVKVFGLSTTNEVYPPYPCTHLQSTIVMEYMARGTIVNYLSSLGRKPSGRVELWILQLADAMAYLHAQGIAHQDIKGENVLIDDTLSVKLADFGCAVYQPTGLNLGQRVFSWGGTPGYIAPEWYTSEAMDLEMLMAHLKAGPGASPYRPSQYAHYVERFLYRDPWPAPKCDVFAFAITCVELYERGRPEYPGIPDLRWDDIKIVFQRLCEERVRPPRPNGCDPISDGMWALVQRCWQHDPLERPTAQQIVTTVKAMMGK